MKNSNDIQIKKELIIWEHEDIRTSTILNLNLGTHSFILIIKGQCLIISLLDNTNYSVVKTDFINFGNMLITGKY